MFGKFLQKEKKEKEEYLLAISFLYSSVDCALWYVDKKGEVHVIDTTHREFSGNWEDRIKASDEAISELEDKLPEGNLVEKVVFGLMPHVLDGDKIKHEFLLHLKDFSKKLSLTPLGFVEIPTALSYFLQKDEGNPQTVILIGLEQKNITITLYKIGKSMGSAVVQRRDLIAADIENGLKQFVGIEVFPSKILLFGDQETCNKAKQELLQYPLQERVNFLHFPKIEVLKNQILAQSASLAAATDLSPGLFPKEDKKEIQNEQTILTSQSTVSDDRVNEIPTKTFRESPIQKIKRRISMVFAKAFLFLGRFSINSFRFRSIIASAGILGGFIIFIGIIGFISWVVPNAKVTILVDAHHLEKEQTITVSPSKQKNDKSVLRGNLVEVEVSGEKEISSTGTKIIGEKAKGEVQVFNKTLHSKTFKQGLVLISSDDLKFTLDEEISVASASENVDSLTYGQGNVSVTAVEIGPEGNISSGSEFVFEDYSSSSYSARNDEAFSGGSSREISVVARDDQMSLSKDLMKDLESQASEKLSENLGKGERLLKESLLTDNIKKIFDKEPGEEARQVKGAFSAKYTALSYREEDLFAFIEQAMVESVPDSFEVRREETEISVSDIDLQDDGSLEMDAQFSLKLYPILDEESLKKALAGKKINDVQEYLKGNSSVIGVKVELVRTLPFMKSRLPVNPSKIEIARVSE